MEPPPPEPDKVIDPPAANITVMSPPVANFNEETPPGKTPLGEQIRCVAMTACAVETVVIAAQLTEETNVLTVIFDDPA